MQWIDARADSCQIGLHQAAVIGSSWVRALLLAGLLDRAELAAQHYRERCQDTAGIGELITSVMCAAVAQSRGRVKTAARWFRQSLTGHGSAFTLLFDLPGALGMGGDATSARQAFEDMAAGWNPSFVFLEPEVLLAQAWVAAAEGLTSQAVARSHHAAELANTRTNPPWRCSRCTPRSASVTAQWPIGSHCWPPRSTAPALPLLPRTPPRWPPTTARRYTPPRSNSKKWARCY
jgi:hypothetical protein